MADVVVPEEAGDPLPAAAVAAPGAKPIREVLASPDFRARAAAKGIALTVEVAPDLPEAVLGDEDKLRQILINLLGNAIKFTTEGGVMLTASWTAGRAEIAVEDTGPGIAEEEMPALFEPFAQTESGRAAREGTGLGLAISRDLAGLMGGRITVRSALGRGSVFRLEVALPEENGAQRQKRRLAEGAQIEDVYAAEVELTQRTYAAEEVAT